MGVVEYATLQDKQRLYVERTLPLIFQRAVDAGRYLPFLPSNPYALHELVRRGRYVREHGPRDDVRSVEQTQAEGGDCEDWAAVQLWHAWNNGHQARVITAGSHRDNFEHVYVEILDDGVWTASNPKGNQQGMDYGRHSDWPVKRRWELHEGRVVEVDQVEGSAGDVQGSGGEVDFHSYFKLPNNLLPNKSFQLKGIKFPGPPAGADTTPINTWGDFFRLVSESQQNWFWKSLSYGQFGPLQVHRATSEKVIQALEDRLDAGQLGMTRGELMHWLRVAGGYAPNDLTARNRLRWLLGSNKRVATFEVETDPTKVAEEVNTLESVNLAFASRWAAEMLEEGEKHPQLRDTLVQAAIDMGGNPNAKDNELAAVWAARVTQVATNQLIALDVLHQLAREHPEWDPETLTTAAREASVTGSGSILSEFFEDAGRWLRRVFVTEVGKGVRAFARNILRVERDAPWAAQFLLRPLGFMTQAQVLNQLGEAMVDGSIATFDEKAVANDFGKDMTAVGQAFIVAAPFLTAIPPPGVWSTLAAASGALFVAGGGMILDAVNENSVLNTGQLGQDQVRTVYVDDYGRPIGPDGLPVDPYQREREIARRQALASAGTPGPDPATQTAGEWRQGSDGLFYGWHDFGSNGQQWWWLALSVDATGTITAAWAWTTEGWVQL